jgi:hypothetical protein
MENRRAEQILGRGNLAMMGREVASKGGRRMNCSNTVHTCICKNDTCRNCSRNGELAVNDSSEEDEFKYDVFDIL